MTITVCSGFSPAGYREYGRNFIDTFDKYWDKSINLLVYTEAYIYMPRGECRILWDCEGARDFHLRHNDDPRRRGTMPIPGWRQKDRKEGYSWRFDAAKFYKQCLIPYDASKTLNNDDIVVWLDGDVVSFSHTSEKFIMDLIGDSHLAYLGRGSYHSEIGFWCVRLCKLSRSMICNLAETYTSDRFLELREHHSAFVFDYVRRQAQNQGLQARDLTPGGGGHVWLTSPLAKHTDHLKGKRRKLMGHSADHPITWWKS